MTASSAALAAAVPPPSGRKVPCEKCPLRSIHALREFSAANAFKKYDVPYHPGALKYFKERNIEAKDVQ